MNITEHPFIADTARDDPSRARDWTTAPLHELTHHIVTTYHDPLRAQLPRLERLAARIARIHAADAPRLVQRIDTVVGELTRELTAHMRAQEQLLFPGICGLECSGACALPLTGAIRAMKDHDRVGSRLVELRAATDAFTPPAWACTSTRALFESLAALASEWPVHLYLENHVLFPEAINLAEAMAGSWT